MVSAIVEATLEAEMTAALGAEKGERTLGRLGYRSGYYARSLVTWVGTLELRVPQDRDGRFSTRLFERYQRSEKALVGALAEMYVQGVSTRKVKAITEELYGHRFSASAISEINKKLDGELAEVRQDLARWLTKWQAKYPKLTNWVEANIEETLTYYRLPFAHHKHMKSSAVKKRF